MLSPRPTPLISGTFQTYQPPRQQSQFLGLRFVQAKSTDVAIHRGGDGRACTSPGFKDSLWENKQSIDPYIHKGKKFFISKGITSSCQGGEWEHWHKLQQHPDFRHGVSGRLTQDAALPCPALFP